MGRKRKARNEMTSTPSEEHFASAASDEILAGEREELP
jgi:hypothetical protein